MVRLLITAGGIGATFPLMAAPTVRVTALSCQEGVLISSDHAPLSQLLREMSQVLGFKLEYRATDSPAFTHDGRHGAVELVAALSHRANLIARYSADQRCPGQLRIDTLWVLPGSPASSTAAARPAAPVGATPAAPRSLAPAPPDPALQEHMRAHGMLLPAGHAGLVPGSSLH